MWTLGAKRQPSTTEPLRLTEMHMVVVCTWKETTTTEALSSVHGVFLMSPRRNNSVFESLFLSHTHAHVQTRAHTCTRIHIHMTNRGLPSFRTESNISMEQWCVWVPQRTPHYYLTIIYTCPAPSKYPVIMAGRRCWNLLLLKQLIHTHVISTLNASVSFSKPWSRQSDFSRRKVGSAACSCLFISISRKQLGNATQR